jgi:hypothetical protein
VVHIGGFIAHTPAHRVTHDVMDCAWVLLAQYVHVIREITYIHLVHVHVAPTTIRIIIVKNSTESLRENSINSLSLFLLLYSRGDRLL